MNWQTLVDPVFSGRLCITLLHSLWQLALLVVAVRIIEWRWARRVETCYSMYVAALLIGLATLPITYSLVGVTLPPQPIQNRIANSAAPLTRRPLAVEAKPVRAVVRQSHTRDAVPKAPESSKAEQSKHTRNWSLTVLQIAPWIFGMYVCGVMIMLARLFNGIWRAHQLVSNAENFDVGPLVELLRSLVNNWSMRVLPALVRSQQITIPKIIGLVRPTILLPAAAVIGLSTSELEMVLAHELAHIRRHDMWVNLLQRLAEAVLFFNPALWYLSRRTSSLREFCCDELTCGELTNSGEETRTRYARALLKVVELSIGTATNRGKSRLCASSELASLAASGKSPSELRRRVAHLFGEELREPIRRSRGGILTIVALAVLLLFGPAVWKSAARSAAAQSAANASREKKKLNFELQVVGPDGKPVPRAHVDIRSNPAPTRGQIKRGEFVSRASDGTIARTDANGQLVLDLPKVPKDFSLGIEAPNFGPYWAAWNSTHHPEKIPSKFTAELEAGWSVGGVVVDSDGKPVAGATIDPSIKYKKRPGDAEELYVGTDLKTDDSGKWSFGSVPASMPEFSIEIKHVDYMTDLRSLTRAEFSIANGKEPTGKIVLSRGLSVAGKVLDDTGKPIAGALIRSKFMNDIRETTSGADGSYRLTGCQPKMARVVVSAKGRAMELKEVRVEPDMQPVDFTLKPGGKIRIRVVDKQGTPIPKTRIFFQRWRGQIGYFEFDHVDDYANDKGVWEWNEAPLDEIKADICPPNGMQLSKQSLIARDEEYVFRPPAALVITGTVVDAETKQPIESFRVVPGIRGPDSHIDWVRQESYAAKDGKFRIRQGRSYPGHLVRIEADGYQAAVSEDIKSDEENVTVDFELKKGVNIAATVLTPAGATAAGAKIVLGVVKSQISIQNGSIDDRQTYAARVDADADGKFHFPPQDTAFQLIVTHPSGYASIHSGPDWKLSTIKLHPWTRVEGTFRAGKKTVANVPLTIQQGALDSWGDDVPHIFNTHDTTTGPDGHFVFERVLPGEGRVGRRIMLMVEDGATEVTSSKMMPLQCIGGETVKVDLGNDGRAIVGQLAPPKDFKEKVLWNFALINVQAERAPLDPPPVPAAAQNDPKKYQAWWNEWKLTKEGRAWRAIADSNERIRKMSPYITASVDRDGTFRIDDVPPGNYELGVRFDQHAAGRLQNYRLSVPAIEAGQPDEALDVGVLTLERN